MKFLLDTHTFIWTLLEPGRLPPAVSNNLRDPNSEVFVSSVSLWEISIKVRIGKMTLVDLSMDDLIPSAKKMGFLFIALTPEEAVSQGNLVENTHFDPFDRMLIWQAIQRKLTLISADKSLKRFEADGLDLLWK